MGSPSIFAGNFTKLLTSRGILRSDGGLNEYDGPFNYINNGHFETGIAGVSTVSCSFTNQFPSGTIAAGGGGVVLSWNSATPLAGRGSLQAATAVNWGGGQGFAFDAFTVRTCDLGKVLNFSIDYSVTAGVSGVKFGGDVVLLTQTFIAYVYDVTAGAWLQPAGFASMNQSSGVGTIQGSFQASVVAGQQYRIAFLAANSSSGGATTVQFDNVSCGRVANISGPSMSDWFSYVPTLGNFGTGPTLINSVWRRVGDSVELLGSATAGSTPSGVTTVSLPPGLVSESGNAKLKTTSYTIVGEAGQNTNQSLTAIATGGVSVLSFGVWASTTLTPSAVLAASQTFSWHATIPIQGWGSNTVQSSDSDTRVCAAVLTGTPAGATALNPIIFPTVTKDTHGVYSTSTGQYTAPISGFYSLQFFGSTAQYGSTATVLAYVAGVQAAIMGFGTGNGNLAGAATVFANAGQAIDFRSNASSSSGIGVHYASITRMSGASVVQASESVNAHYSNTASTGVSGTAAKIPWAIKDFDSHAAMSAAGDFTCPVSGKYMVSAALVIAIATGNQVDLFVYKNGAVAQRLMINFAAGGGVGGVSGTAIVNCIAGDVLSIWSSASASGTLSATAGVNNVNIARIGN